jgi:hypothetical protein
MTVILDPGNDSNSFDSTPKMWRLTAGQWKTKDTADLAAAAAAAATAAAALAAETTLYNNEVASYNASQASLATMTTNYNNEVTAYNDEVTLYNGMVAQRDAKTTTGVSTTSFSGTWPNSTSSYSGTLATLTAPRTGYGQASASVRTNSSVGTHGQARIKVNGTVVATGTQTGHNSSSGTPEFSVTYRGSFTNGDTVTVEYAGDGNTTLNSGDFALTVGSV